MKFLSLTIFILFSFIISSQTACYINPTLSTTLSSVGITSADFNADGYMDIATATNSLSINYGSGNGSFLAAVNYVHGLTNMSMVSDIVSSDFNGDGKPDVAISSYTNMLCVMFKTTGGFSSPQLYNLGGGCIKLMSKDVNNDNKPDIISLNIINNSFNVLLNNGSGSFVSNSTYTLPAEPLAFAGGNFNNDSYADLAISYTVNSVGLFLNSGAGAFSPTTALTTSTYVPALAAGDINNDGKEDLVLTHVTSSVTVLHGSGNTTFSVAATYSLGGLGGSAWTQVRDINGDLLPDILVHDGRSLVNSYLNNGTNQFSVSSWVSYPFMSDFTLADFTGDGRPDLVGTFGGAIAPASILLNNGSGGFLTASAYKRVTGGSQNNILDVHAADMDNDGKADILTADNNNNSFSILYGNGTGNFTTTTVYPTSSTLVPLYCTSGDFNSDGLRDIAVVGYTNNLTIYLNAGNRLFTYFATYAVGVSPWKVEAADMNNDGNLDLIVANYGSNNITVRLGLGNGSFGASAAYAVGGNAMGVAIADYNNDGNKDVAVAAWNNSITVFPGTATGVLSPGTGYIVTSVPHGIVAGDFNTDGAPDLAILCGFSYSLAVKLNNGTGSFGGNVYYNLGYTSESIICGDYNLDGKLDLAIGSQQSVSTIKIYNGSATGTFAPGVDRLIGDVPRFISSADFNNDGVPDFASASDYFVGVLLSASIPTLSVSGPTLGCSLAPLTLTATGAQAYAWSAGASGGASTATYFPSSTQVVSVTAFNSPLCPSSQTRTITVIPSPTLTIIPSSTILCSGASASLSVSGAQTFSWNTSAVSSSIIVTPANTSTYSATGTGTNGCSTTVIQQVSVNPIPTLSLSNDTTICAGGTASFAVSGASLYAWSQGTVGSLVFMSPTSSSCYTVTGTSNSCTSTAVGCITVSALPQVTVAPASSTVCNGTSQTFTASGAQSYLWSGNVNTATNNILVANTSTYSVTGTSNGCSSTITGTLVVNPNCSDVWPGDADNNGVVSGADVLELGLAASLTGAPRALASNNYVAQMATNWTGSVSTGKNLCHADCNGDGTINANDTLAIYNNFSLTHAFKPAPSAGAKLSLYSPNGPLVRPGEWISIHVNLFDSSPDVIYGTYYDLSFDANVIEPDSVSLHYVPSFINVNNQNIDFRKLFFSNGKISTATVRTNKQDATGNGQIAEFRVKLKSGLPNNTAINFLIDNSGGVLATGAPLSISGGSLQIFTDNSLGFGELQQEPLLIYPNPASTQISIKYASSECIYKLMDLSGRVLLFGMFSGSMELPVSKIFDGTYILSVENASHVQFRKLVIAR